jgi:hypothetical protein
MYHSVQSFGVYLQGIPYDIRFDIVRINDDDTFSEF